MDANLVNPNQQAGSGSKQTGPNTQSPAAPPPVTTTSNQSGKKKKYVLNATDKLFSQLRDQNFAVVGGVLNKIAKRINENYEVCYFYIVILILFVLSIITVMTYL